MKKGKMKGGFERKDYRNAVCSQDSWKRKTGTGEKKSEYLKRVGLQCIKREGEGGYQQNFREHA